MKDQIEERSSQLLRNLSSCEKKAWKKFRLSFRNCLSCVVTARIFLLFYLSSAVQIYVSYIYIHLFILHGYITNSQYDQLPVGLIAQLVEHCTGIAEVMGSNPVQAWIFFRLSFRNCLSCVVTARIFLLFVRSFCCLPKQSGYLYKVSANRSFVNFYRGSRTKEWSWVPEEVFFSRIDREDFGGISRSS